MSRPTENELKEQYKIISRSKKNELRAYNALDLANWAIDRALDIPICTQRELDLESKIKQMQETINKSIPIPDEEDWDKNVIYIQLVAFDKNFKSIEPISKPYHRSKPKYQPEDGPVLYRVDGVALAGVIVERILYSAGLKSALSIVQCKPFNEKYIGAKWEDVPDY